MPTGDSILTIGILLFIGFIVYTRIRNQSMKETFDEIKELFIPEQKQ